MGKHERLPDHSGNEWNLIVSFFEKGYGELFDQTEIVHFFCGNAEKRSTFKTRLHCDLKRRSMDGKNPEVARINKRRKTIDGVYFGATLMISETGGAEAVQRPLKGQQPMGPRRAPTVPRRPASPSAHAAQPPV
jgi:hypothetical protein